jgi:hypothetical protein
VVADSVSFRASYEAFTRSIYLSDYFFQHPRGDSTVPPRFRIPKPNFHPRAVDGHTPSVGIAEFHEASFASLSDLVARRPPHVPNLSWMHRKALSRLWHDDSIVIGFCDKNLGLFADDASAYEQHARDSLAATHRVTDYSVRHTISITRYALFSGLRQYLPSLPDWAASWVKAICEGKHPRTAAAFAIPAFRLLYKVHKAQLGFRPITGNHCWVTQPLALLLAFLVLPYCQTTSSHVSDTDAFQRRLNSVVVGPHQDQMAGACALVLGSLGGLMLVLFKSNCLKIKCCFGLVQCTRRPPSIDDEDAQPEPEPEA